jgi:hypothetical protein
LKLSLQYDSDLDGRALTEEKAQAHRVFVLKSKREIPLGRPRNGWEDNNKIDPKRNGMERHRLDSSGLG